MAHGVTLELPPTPAYLRIARVAVVFMAQAAGLSYEDIDDLRIALDELWSVLAHGNGSVALCLDIRDRDGTVVIRGRRHVPPASDGLTTLSRRRLDAAVDRYALGGVRPELDGGHGERSFVIEKAASWTRSR